VLALLLVGVVGGLRRVDNTQARLDSLYTRTKLTILSAARDPLARSVPPTLRPEQLSARDVTVGWLLQGVREHRIPAAPKLVIVDLRASSDFRPRSSRTRPGARRICTTSPPDLSSLTGRGDRRVRQPGTSSPRSRRSSKNCSSRRERTRESGAVRPVVINSFGSIPTGLALAGMPVPHPYAG
jgi:hypothetical protein